MLKINCKVKRTVGKGNKRIIVETHNWFKNFKREKRKKKVEEKK